MKKVKPAVIRTDSTPGPKPKNDEKKRRAFWFMATNEDVDLLGGKVLIAAELSEQIKVRASKVRQSLSNSK